MASALIEFCVLAAIIIAAGTVLTRCADAFAEITGFGRLLVGSILLAGSTSLPELTVDLSAIRLDLPNLAIGDLIGSSLMNLLILAVIDLSHQAKGRMLSRAAAAHALSGTLGIALAAVVGIGILIGPRFPNASLLGIHLTVYLLALGYILGVRMIFIDQRMAVREAKEAAEAKQAKEAGDSPKASQASRESILGGTARPGLARYIAGFIAAAAVIFFIGPRLAEAAGKIAELSGLASSFVGTTFVALSTSLPELVASITAVRMGAFDLVVGNVFGSNAFNMVLFLPLDAAYPGALFAVANEAHVISVLAVIVCTAVVILGQLYWPDRRRRFLEPDAWLVILLICGALGLVYATA
jgi:cation:H+ antiporter